MKYLNKKGSTLTYVIIIFSVLMIIGSLLINIGIVESQQFKSVEHKNNAYYVARSAVESTASIFINRKEENLDFINRVKDLSINESINLDVPFSIDIGDGKADIVITKVAEKQIKIAGEGKYEKEASKAILFLDLSKTNDGLGFTHALFSKASLDVSGAERIEGTVASNDNITVSNGANTTLFIKDGNHYSNEDYILDEANGLVDEYSDNYYPDVVESDLPVLPISKTSSLKSNHKVTIDESLEYDSITIRDVDFVIPEGEEELVIIVDDITIKGNINIYDDDGDLVDEKDEGTVKIYVKNSAIFQTPKDMVNHPGNFIIICLAREPQNSNDYSVVINGNSTFKGVIYAPGTLAKIQTKQGKHSSAFVGALIADYIKIQGNSDIKFKDPEFDEPLDFLNITTFKVNHWE